MHILRVVIILLMSSASLALGATEADSIMPVSGPKHSGNWIKQLVDNGFKLHDPSINYPRFARFCLKVYDWGDRTFNSYDSTYVVSTGKNWKITGKSYNWAESYFMQFTGNTRLHMISEIYSDIGASIGFMAVNVGHTFNANDLFGNPVASRKNWDYSFTSALFAASINYTSTDGGVRITKFGDFNLQGHSFDFNSVKQETTSANMYYFFNHRKYSQAAAYCYSKYQLKSAGSLIVGLNFNKQNIDLDFSALPSDMLTYLPGKHDRYTFHYKDYNIICGYAYNWVLHPRRWLVNATVLPAIGYRHTYENSTDGKKDMFSTNVTGLFSVVYNHRSLFASLTGRFDGNIYFGSSYTFMNSIESLSLVVGARF